MSNSVKISDQKSLIECVLYILQRTQGLDIYHLWKILYFAQQHHLAEWGSRMICDDFCALDYGPVPTALYDAAKGQANRKFPELLGMFQEAISRGTDDAKDALFAKRAPDMDYISVADRDSMDKSIFENAHLSFNQLMRKSHDSAWESTHAQGRGVIPIADIAKAAGSNEAMLEYITDNESLDNRLRY